MKKRILLALLGLAIVIGVLAAVKALQIRAMIAQGKERVPPPETVTTAVATAESWPTSLTAVGSLTAVQGVTVASELSGKVAEIAFESGAKVKQGRPADSPGHQLGRGPAARRRGAGRPDADHPCPRRQDAGGTDHFPGRLRHLRREPRAGDSPGQPDPRDHRQEDDPGPLRRPSGHPAGKSRPAAARRRSHRHAASPRPDLRQLHLSPAGAGPFAPRPSGARDVRLPPRSCDRRAHDGRNPAGGFGYPQHPGAGDGRQPGGKAPAGNVRQRGGRPSGTAKGAVHPGHGCALRSLRELGLRCRRGQGGKRRKRRFVSSSCGSARSEATSWPSPGA